MIVSKIENSVDFNKAIKSAGTRGKNLVNSYADMVAFAFLQVQEHGNGTPATALRNAIPMFAAKPKGFTVKGFDAFIEAYTRLEFNKKDKVFKAVKGKNPEALPVDNVRFWEYEQDNKVQPRTVQDRMLTVIKAAIKEDMTRTEVLLLAGNLFDQEQATKATPANA